jgi:NADPH2:quinone reductase
VRAAICHAHGGPDNVVVEDIDSPALGPGQVRVAVDTAAVNFPDVLIVANDYQIKVPTPFVPGSEFAGVVSEAAADVTNLTIGDRVFGSTLIGGFAQEVAAPAAGLSQVPADVALEVAAGFGVAHRTAYHVLRSVAKLAPGEDLVVLGAGGGVGLATVQLGKHLGATVTAVASSEAKLDAARICGADHTINYRERDLRAALKEDRPDGVDVVVDPVGGELSEPALRGLRRDGRFVTVGYAAGSIPKIPLNLVLLKGISILGFEFLGWSVANAGGDLERNEAELMELLSSGRIVPYVEARFTLDETAAALHHVAVGRAIGKVLLTVAER